MSASEPHVDVTCASGLGCIGATRFVGASGVGAGVCIPSAEKQVLRSARRSC